MGVRPPADAPPVTPLPAASQRGFTFGCLNNPAKISDACLEAWAAILQGDPRRRGWCCWPASRDAGANRLLDRFAERGISRGPGASWSSGCRGRSTSRRTAVRPVAGPVPVQRRGDDLRRAVDGRAGADRGRAELRLAAGRHGDDARSACRSSWRTRRRSWCGWRRSGRPARGVGGDAGRAAGPAGEVAAGRRCAVRAEPRRGVAEGVEANVFPRSRDRLGERLLPQPLQLRGRGSMCRPAQPTTIPAPRTRSPRSTG